MSGTTLTYNGVELKNVRTLAFRQRCVYDESETDLLYHEFTIRVESIVHTDMEADIGAQPPTTPSTTADAHQSLQTTLMHPRGLFEYKTGDDVLLQANPLKGSRWRDVKNGPFPKSCDISNVYNDNFLRIEYEIQVNVVRCNKDNDGESPSDILYGAKRGSDILNNRWRMEDTLDRNLGWTRTWEGQLRVAHIAVNPQLYRALVVPPLQKGYRRKSMRFGTSPSGLVLTYSIEDVQENAAPPSPATGWDASYTESTGKGGAITHSQVNVSLWGPPHVNKKFLLTRAAQIVQARLGDLTPGRNAILEAASITDHLSDPNGKITMQVTIMRSGKESTRHNNVITTFMGVPLNLPYYDSKQFPVPDLYDRSSPTAVFFMYLQSPCSSAHGITGAYALPAVDVKGEKDKTKVEFYKSTGETPLPNDPVSSYSEDQKKGFPYTFYEIETTYKTKRGNYQLPIACIAATAPTDATSAIVLLHKAMTQKLIKIRATRIGVVPELPEPTEVIIDANGVVGYLLEDDVLTVNPNILPDGKNFLYQAEARYLYAMERAPLTNEKLQMGSSPVDNTDPKENVFDGNKSFSKNKIVKIN